MAGLLKPTAGEVIIDNKNTSNKQAFLDIRKMVGIVFQNPDNQIIFNNVYDDLIFALNNLGLEDKELRIKEGLEKVNMQEYIEKNTYELSLGQKQRITIAGVLSINPKYIIFDEPTTMLDSEGKEDVYNIVSGLKGKEYTIIYVTNVVNEILMSDRIITINEGEITNIFNKNDILEYVDVLKESGFKIPAITQILAKLKEAGIDITLEKWTMEELIEKIIGVINK
ncbi:MAG: ATP-binding cassette domain-containing protein [Oscillospiraceae bacterium]|nr:ATP-binding cassette domain-containing protein [Oscillospiraceae bacterium]